MAVVAGGYDPEPLSWTNRYLLASETESVVDGLALLVESLGAHRGVLCVPAGDSGLRARAAEALAGREGLELGDAAAAAEAPGTLTVPRLERLRQLSEAARGRPPISVYLSCAGEVREPALRRVPLGTPLREVIEGCGGPAVESFVLVTGGALAGGIEGDLDRPVNADTQALLLLPEGHPLARAKGRSLAQVLNISRSACCGCGFCTACCSAALAGEDISPHRIMRQLAQGLAAPEEILRGALCCRECGICEAVCPMALSARRMNRVLKRSLQAAGLEAPERGKPAPERGQQGPPRMPGGRPAEARRRLPPDWFLARLGLERYARRAPAWGGELAPARVELELPPGSVLRVAEGDSVRQGEPVAEASGRIVFAAVSGCVRVAEEQRLIIAAETGEIR